jgi:hypothetical protein
MLSRRAANSKLDIVYSEAFRNRKLPDFAAIATTLTSPTTDVSGKPWFGLLLLAFAYLSD